MADRSTREAPRANDAARDHDVCIDMDCPQHGVAADLARQSAFYAENLRVPARS